MLRYKYFLIFIFVLMLCLFLQLLLNENLNMLNIINFIILSLSKENFKIHVFYVHHMDSKSEAVIENFKFFMHFGVNSCNSRVDYRIILNTNNISTDFQAKIAEILNNDKLFSQINKCSNVKLIKNLNTRDLCVHAEQLKSEAWKRDKKKYKYFFFINSSTRGPFLPNYWTEPSWKIFTNKFLLNPKLAATGPYLSTEFHPHIQSFFVALDVRGLNILENT
jgi:hypothetical protein